MRDSQRNGPAETRNGRAATARVERAASSLVVRLGGAWRIVESVPRWEEVAPDLDAAADAAESDVVRLCTEDLDAWDSSLLAFLQQARSWCDAKGWSLQDDALPRPLRRVLGELSESRHDELGQGSSPERGLALELARNKLRRGAQVFELVGDVVLAALSAAAGRRRFPWGSWVEQMRLCGAAALPIVGLISVLVGVIVSYQASIQLRRFGADIYVADLIALSVVREMAPVMAAIVIAGRTGSAFAAEIGKMVAGAEIDALRAIGVSPASYVVLPRVAALVPMLPLLTLYADVCGIVGGAVTANHTLGIPLAALWSQMRESLDGRDLAAGLIKSVTFAVLIGLAGCLRGIQCERTSAGVGAAATSAVVTGIFLVILADALFGEVFSILGV